MARTNEQTQTAAEANQSIGLDLTAIDRLAASIDRVFAEALSAADDSGVKKLRNRINRLVEKSHACRSKFDQNLRLMKSSGLAGGDFLKTVEEFIKVDPNKPRGRKAAPKPEVPEDELVF